MDESSSQPPFEPRIVAFCCNWCSYAGADLAGVSRLPLPPDFHVIRVMCSARVAPEWVLESFAKGIDGVLVLGCHLGDCHYIDGNHRTAKRFGLLAEFLDVVGLSRDRLKLGWVSASEGKKFQDVVTSFVDRVRELGPVGELAPQADVPRLGGGVAVEDDGAVPDLGAVREEARRLLAEEDVAGLVGLRAGPGGPTPHVFDSVDDLDALEVEAAWPLATFAATVLAAIPEGRLGVTSSGADARALVEMAKLNQVDLDRLVLVPTSDGVAPADPRTGVLAALDPEARRAFWEDHLSRCIKCYGCRNVCPVCLCDRCVLEEEAWVETGRIPPPLPFHWIRAWHVADRCVLCGACEAACPAEIPLIALHAAIAEKVGDLFGYVPGRDVSEPTPLVTPLDEGAL